MCTCSQNPSLSDKIQNNKSTHFMAGAVPWPPETWGQVLNSATGPVSDLAVLLLFLADTKISVPGRWCCSLSLCSLCTQAPSLSPCWTGTGQRPGTAVRWLPGGGALATFGRSCAGAMDSAGQGLRPAGSTRADTHFGQGDRAGWESFLQGPESRLIFQVRCSLWV